jgi:hypothetical protein
VRSDDFIGCPNIHTISMDHDDFFLLAKAAMPTESRATVAPLPFIPTLHTLNIDMREQDIRPTLSSQIGLCDSLHTLDLPNLCCISDNFASVVAALPHIHTLDVRHATVFSAKTVELLDSSRSLHTVLLDQRVQFTRVAAEYIDNKALCKCPYLRNHPLPPLTPPGLPRYLTTILMMDEPAYVRWTASDLPFPVMCPFLRGTKLHELDFMNPRNLDLVAFGQLDHQPNLLLSRVLLRHGSCGMALGECVWDKRVFATCGCNYHALAGAP